ncbi:hypothetical protein T12_9554 [Trichinella patagoniensis]|uniref:Uncharacterized protein n=1 Tax=Trichinella patagoniensis TaxID=990121 RepID=A0A0V0ZFT9_9BILA|nr:hypothetical protein T12_9554 [Trichinella patagoniensis]
MDASLSTVLRAFIIDWQQFHCTFVFTQFSKNVSIQDPTITDLKNLKYTPMSSSLTAVMQITRHTSSALDDKRMSVV